VPIHDRYARVTPFELLMPEEDFADERFPFIRKEAEERGGGALGSALASPEQFVLLSEVGAVLRAVRGEEEDPHLIQHHGALLFHAFHSWEVGCPLFLLTAPVARYVVDSGPGEGKWSPSLPGPAGYVQLPQHLFWIPGSEGTPPESLDGFFWSAPDPGQVSLLVVMGIRKDRPGLSVVPLPTLPLAAAGAWASLQVRPKGKDFRSSLPGAELEHLYALEAGGEAVKLAMRVFWYLDTHPGSVERGEEREGGARTHGQEAAGAAAGLDAAESTAPP
jgi:hypothetical protein